MTFVYRISQLLINGNSKNTDLRYFRRRCITFETYCQATVNWYLTAVLLGQVLISSINSKVLYERGSGDQTRSVLMAGLEMLNGISPFRA